MSLSLWKIPLQGHEVAKVDQSQLRKEQSWHPQKRTNWWVQMLTMTMIVLSANALYHSYRSCTRVCRKAVRPECEATDQTEWSRNSALLDRTRLTSAISMQALKWRMENYLDCAVHHQASIYAHPGAVDTTGNCNILMLQLAQIGTNTDCLSISKTRLCW